METNPNLEITPQDIRLILDEVQYAALVVDSHTEEIILANQIFIEMIQLANDDIKGNRADAFIRDICLTGVSDGHSQNGILTRKEMQPIHVSYSIKYFGKKDKYILTKIIPTSQNFDDQKVFYEEILKKQILLFNNINTKEREELFSDFIDISDQLLIPDFSLIYQLNRQKNELTRFPERDSFFPETIPILELSRIREIDYWEPGKRVLSEIHRVCRINNINSLYTIPINLKKETFGLMVFAYREIVENSVVRKKMVQFSEWVNSILDIHTKFESNSRTESEMSIEMEKYQAILDILNDGYVILDEKNRIIEFNEVFQSLIDYSPVELINGDLNLFMNTPTIEKIYYMLNGLQDGNRQEIIQIHNRQGSEIPVSIRTKQSELKSGINRICLFKDIKELEITRKRLDEIEGKASLGEVVADFAHEVRNPINNLTTGLQLLSIKLQPNDENQDIISRMQEDCIRMNYLMESVLAFARQSDEKNKEVNLVDLINRLIFRYKSKFAEKDITLHFRSEVDHEKALVLADQRALEQVIINLINNAYEAIVGRGGTISVVITRQNEHPEHICIKVADTGAGIPEDMKEKIFEPFVSEKPGGTGLGLAIVRKIVDANNGWIDLETYLGGTIFNIFLPIIETGEVL